MKVPLALLLLGACLAPGVARASCIGVDTGNFGQLNTACGGGTAYCYIQSPGSNTTGSIVGSFWALGSGNPVVGAGNDSGGWQPMDQWLPSAEPGVWLSGAWSSSPLIDGCINGAIAPGESSEIMAVGLSDQDIFGSRGYFAAAAVSRHPGSFPEFDFSTGIQTNILMAPLPRPRFFISPTSIQVFHPSLTDVARGFYSDGSADLNQVIVGYRIYKRVGWPVPPDRRRSSWTALSPVLGLNQDWSSSQCFCCGGSSLAFATALVFSGGFESDHVSQHVAVDPCIPEHSFDLDADGHLPPQWGGDDCNDDDGTVYPGAPEVNDGRDNQCPFSAGYGSVDEISGLSGFYHAGDKAKFTWWFQDGATLYAVARSQEPDFGGSCTTATTPLTIFTDHDEPPPGDAFHYLVRAAAPYAGSWGTRSGGVERAIACP